MKIKGVNNYILDTFMKHEQNKFLCKSFLKLYVNFRIHESVRIFKMLVGTKEMYACSVPHV